MSCTSNPYSNHCKLTAKHARHKGSGNDSEFFVRMTLNSLIWNNGAPMLAMLRMIQIAPSVSLPLSLNPP
ncbi:unnamed protein product [Haemonchus placei]|uniref:Uncharacterized protein n=1 Tax=Haemonchus placei TaxID=6290 RepID=A0A0N4X6S8_HAEPC|nr:unnamed protein product [Haemonchus placei]